MISKIVSPENIVSYQEFSARPCPVPQEAGIYAWFFRELLPSLPISCSQTFQGFHLLYVGIAPSRSDSSNNLRKRIRKHFNGDASRSTLRLTLGCLLSSQLGLTLRPTGKDGRLTYGKYGEAALSKWIQDNARVGWVCHPEPYLEERTIIQEISPPLNLQHNECNPFHAQLKELRSQCRSQALVTKIQHEWDTELHVRPPQVNQHTLPASTAKPVDGEEYFGLAKNLWHGRTDYTVSPAPTFPPLLSIDETMASLIDYIETAYSQHERIKDNLYPTKLDGKRSYELMMQCAAIPGTVTLVMADSSMLADIFKTNIVRGISIDARRPTLCINDHDIEGTKFSAALLAATSGCPLVSLTSGLISDSEWGLISEGLGKLHGAPLFIITRSSEALAQHIYGWIDASTVDNATGVVVVDGLASSSVHSVFPVSSTEFKQRLKNLEDDLSVLSEFAAHNNVASIMVIGDAYLHRHFRTIVFEKLTMPVDSLCLAQLTSLDCLRLTVKTPEDLVTTDYKLALASSRIEWAKE